MKERSSKSKGEVKPSPASLHVSKTQISNILSRKARAFEMMDKTSNKHKKDGEEKEETKAKGKAGLKGSAEKGVQYGVGTNDDKILVGRPKATESSKRAKEGGEEKPAPEDAEPGQAGQQAPQDEEDREGTKKNRIYPEGLVGEGQHLGHGQDKASSAGAGPHSEKEAPSAAPEDAEKEGGEEQEEEEVSAHPHPSPQDVDVSGIPPGDRGAPPDTGVTADITAEAAAAPATKQPEVIIPYRKVTWLGYLMALFLVGAFGTMYVWLSYIDARKHPEGSQAKKWNLASFDYLLNILAPFLLVLLAVVLFREPEKDPTWKRRKLLFAVAALLLGVASAVIIKSYRAQLVAYARGPQHPPPAIGEDLSPVERRRKRKEELLKYFLVASVAIVVSKLFKLVA